MKKVTTPNAAHKMQTLIKKDLRYILFNKPYGVLSQFTADHPGQRTLAEFGIPEDVYPAGRLDKDSEGLLLLTNDGSLIKKMLDPKEGHQRTYLVQVEGQLNEEALDKLREGVDISGYKTLPAHAEFLRRPPAVAEREPPIRARKQIPTSWLELTLVEGKNRQVRHMTAAVGFPTLRLIRISLGDLKIKGLEAGTWKKIPREKLM